MSSWLEGPEAIGAVDAILAGVGLKHGKRATRNGAWKDGERVRRPKAAASKGASQRSQRPGVVRVEAWAGLPWLRAGFSTREGGASIAYGRNEQNLGWTQADPPETVAANRKRFLAEVAGQDLPALVTVRQFHSPMVRVVEAHGGALSTTEGKAVLRGDGLITALPGVLLGIQTADCVPVLVADMRQRVVGAFHAGWRGTLARIVERGIGDLRLRFGSQTEDIVAAVGPCIAPCCFAVGEEVRYEFQSQFEYWQTLFSEVYDSDPVREKYPLLFLTARAPGHSNIGPQIHLDLVEANRRQLLNAGVSAEHISIVGECTACTRLASGSRKYFSHRADAGFTGRMLSVIGIAPGAKK